VVVEGVEVGKNRIKDGHRKDIFVVDVCEERKTPAHETGREQGIAQFVVNPPGVGWSD
jgi:hypothetical protein